MDMESLADLSNCSEFYDAVVPSANVFATTEEITIFFEMLLRGGVWEGKRIFQPETIAEAVRPTGSLNIDRIIYLPMRYSAGMMLGNDPLSLLYGPNTGEAYGHMGFTNIMCWADPRRDVSVALLNTGKALFGPHLAASINLLNLISRNCPTLKK